MYIEIQKLRMNLDYSKFSPAIESRPLAVVIPTMHKKIKVAIIQEPNMFFVVSYICEKSKAFLKHVPLTVSCI